MKNKKLINALLKVIEASNVFDFKTGKQLKDTSVLLDWSKSKIYPVRGTSMKILGLKLKITNDKLKNLPANAYMISFIPKGRSNTVMVQLDEVGGDLRRTVAEDKQISQLDDYIKKDLVKDLSGAYTKMGMVINIKQKLAPDLSEKIAEMSGHQAEGSKDSTSDAKEFISALYQTIGPKRYLHDLESVFDRVEFTATEKQALRYLINDLRHLKSTSDQNHRNRYNP